MRSGELADDPLVTIGAHTRRHYALAKLTLADARAEIDESVRRIEREIGQPCRHFSYPYGDETSAGQREFDLAKELGIKTGVTTRKGLIHRPARRRADRAAARLAQRRLSEAALRESAAERRPVRAVQRHAESLQRHLTGDVRRTAPLKHEEGAVGR